MVMKKILATLLFVPAMAQAEFMSGNNLYKDMQGDALDNIHALGYVLGAADSAINVTVCPPEGVKAGQVYDIIKKFLEANPAIRHYSADTIVRTRLEALWPCKQQGRGRGT
jgi:hypothetical protein